MKRAVFAVVLCLGSVPGALAYPAASAAPAAQPAAQSGVAPAAPGATAAPAAPMPGADRFGKMDSNGDGKLVWEDGANHTLNDKILRPASDPFQPTGGLRQLSGNLGRGVIKVSAVAPERHLIEAPCRIFHDQNDVKAAFKAGEFTSDTVVVVRFQGPQANGMPELHSLTPMLSVLQDRGFKMALVTDGRMSGASGKVPAAIHVSPEAAKGGPLARLRDGDIVRLDAVAGTLSVLAADFDAREPITADLSANRHGIGRELFEAFRRNVGTSETGAAVVI